MKAYKNISGDAGVRSYEIHEHSIIVRFEDGSEYLYDAVRPGRRHVEAMKMLAAGGEGLTGYINRHVRQNYALKLR